MPTATPKSTKAKDATPSSGQAHRFTVKALKKGKTTRRRPPSEVDSRQKTPSQNLHVDPIESAKDAGLRYMADSRPGIRRQKTGKGFRYIATNGSPLTDEATLKRIRSLAIPPAYRDVWISPIANGHLQATGIDTRGRKQYRYHPKWRAVRDETKYTRLMAFAKALPEIRKATHKALSKPGMPREKVLATIVQLLEKTLIRVGNEEYARDNKSHGLTTMRNRHVDVKGSNVTFTFKGKSGINHTIDLSDRRLAKVIERLTDLPGQELFQFLDENGVTHSIDSSDVNEYLKEISGQDFTAKDFRTWAGTVLAAMALQEFQNFDSEAQAKKNIVSAIESVAGKLGNTPAVCRKCYVHPAVLDSYLDGSMIDTLQQRATRTLSKGLKGLRPEEAAVVGLLSERLAAEQSNGRKAG